MLLKGCVNYSCIASCEGKKNAEILTVDWGLQNQLFQSFSEYNSSLSIISLNYRIKNNSDSSTFKTGELLVSNWACLYLSLATSSKYFV